MPPGLSGLNRIDYRLPGGIARRHRAHYLAGNFQVMIIPREALIRWWHCCENGDFQPVYYRRGWGDLLFLEAARFFLDQEGNPGDELHGEDFVRIEKG